MTSDLSVLIVRNRILICVLLGQRIWRFALPVLMQLCKTIRRPIWHARNTWDQTLMGTHHSCLWLTKLSVHICIIRLCRAAGPSVCDAVLEYVCSTVAFHMLVQIFIPLFETKCVGSK